MSYYPLISIMPKTPAFTGLLDTYPSAAVAYSLRKLRSAYSGSAIRVRRSVDNTEQDFGFDNSGDLDVNSIENFVGWNLFAYSEQLQQFYWVKDNLTVTADSIVAPDGNTTGDILFETVASGTHVMGRTLAVIAGNEYTVSFWVQPQGRTFIRVATAVNLSWDGITIPVAWVNLSTGTIISQSAGYGGTFQITTAPNGWFLINYTVRAVNNATSQTIELNLSTNGSQIAYVGDVTKGIAVWGLQVTQSSTVKPYRQTLAIAEGQGFVTTWYDQSGNANNATQATAANQAQIVLNGNLIIDAITGKITTTWTTDFYNLTNLITTVQLMYHYMVFNRTLNSVTVSGLTKSTTNFPSMLRWFATSGEIRSYINTGITHSTNTSTGSNLITTLRDSSNVVKMFKNNVALTTGISSDIGATLNTWGNSNASINFGNFAELVHWNNDQEANRTGIETNANTYWNAY